MEEQLTKINKLLNIEVDVSKNKKLVFIKSDLTFSNYDKV